MLGWLRTCLLGRVRLARDRSWLGRKGEAIACNALKRKGYAILGRRVRSRLGEIDLVAREGGDLVFIEVKTRRGSRFGRPQEAVGWRKQRKLIALARWYMARRGLSDSGARFDVVSVEMGPGAVPRVEIYRGAFEEV